MILSIQRKIYSSSDPTSGQFILAHDYLLHNHWDGKLPVNLQGMIKSAGIGIRSIPECHKDKSIYTYGDGHIYCSLQRLSKLSLFERTLQMAIHLQFAIRKLSSIDLDESSELYIKGVKIARHLIMPDMTLLQAAVAKTPLTELVSMFGNQIPAEELALQLEKIQKKFLQKKSP